MAMSVHLCRLLHDRRTLVLREWCQALVRPRLTALDSTTLEERLDALIESIGALLLAEPFAADEAQDVGVSLARLVSVHSEALGCTLDVLGRWFEGLPAEDALVLQPRLMAVLSQLAIGFLREHGEIVREQQHDLHRALSDARQRADAARRASEARYQAVVREAAEGIVLVDCGTTRIVETNAAFQAMAGYTAEELLGVPLHAIAIERQATIDDGIRQTVRAGRRDVGERLCRRRDGTLLPLEASVTAIRVGRETLLCVVARDISERLRAEAELDAARRGIAASRQEERGRLARELHDGAVQTLAGVRYQLAAQRGTRDRSGGKPAKESLQIEADIARVINELRELIGELRPTGLDEGGLIAALENYVGSLPVGGEIILDVSAEVADLPRPLALCLFLVTREAVRNALRHGQAGRVSIHLRPGTAAVILRIADNGVGFTVPRPLSVMAQTKHFGVLGIAERVSEVQGRLRVRSRPGRGTIVTVWIPWRAGTDEA